MSVSPEDIAASRALRDEARAIVTAHIGEVRADLSPQTIGQRIKHKASEQAVEMIDETRAVASDNKLVIGATVATLVGWFTRKPLIGLVRRITRGKKPERLWPWFVK